jgi:imidazolonepropionase-like amidohydrolase
MRNARPLAVIVLALTLACSHRAALVTRPANAARSLVIRNVRIFDAPQAALMPGLHDVVVRDGRIAAIAPPGAAADGLAELDGKGGTLLPGLVDLHRHTGTTAEPPGRFVLPDVDANLAAFLYAGVTTVLDLGSLSPDVFRVRAAVASGKQLGPHVYAAGPIFTAVGGHPVEMLRPNLPWFVGWYVIPRATREIASPADGTAAVRALVAERPDVLKIVVDAGVGDVPRLTAESFTAITAAGHAAGVRSVTHVTSAADALLAVRNGTDALAHMPSLDEVSESLAATIAAAHVPVIATLAIWDLIATENPRGEADVLPIEREVAGPDLLTRMLAPRHDPSPFQRAAARGRDGRRRSFATLRRAGVTILAGSDACNPTDLPGAGLHLELHTMVDFGATPGEALKAATVDNARFLAGPDAEFGTIAAGQRADLVLIAGDPTAHIDELGNVAAVVLDGAVLSREHGSD